MDSQVLETVLVALVPVNSIEHPHPHLVGSALYFRVAATWGQETITGTETHGLQWEHFSVASQAL